MTTLPLNSKNRSAKVLASMRNHEKFTSAKVLLVLLLYYSYMKENTPDEFQENGRKIYETLEKHRPDLVKHINSI